MKIAPEIRDEINRLADERDGEFDRDELVPAIAPLLDGGRLANDMARAIIAKHFRDSDRSSRGSVQGCLFSLDSYVALGGRQVIRRGSMAGDHAERRRAVIGQNYKAQFDAWRAEDDYLADRIPWLREHPDQRIEDYEDIDGQQQAAA